MSASAHRYTCDQLGACQSRATPCSGCSHPYAPGTIEHHRRQPWHRMGTPAQRKALTRWLIAAALLAFSCAAIGFSAGLYAGA